MFRSLPPARHDEDALRDLADKMTSPAEDAPTPETQNDAEENVGNPLGDPQHRADEHRETEAEDGTADEDHQHVPPPLLGRSHRLGG